MSRHNKNEVRGIQARAKPSLLPHRTNAIWVRIAAGGALLFVLASCAPPEASSYLLHNATGQRIVAATVSDAAGGQAATTRDILDDDVEVLPGSWSTKTGQAVTVQWLGGQGLARWREATLPLKGEQAEGDALHIYLRPDQRVCASFRADDGALAPSPAVTSASLSCSRSTELVRLAPGMARGMKQGSVAHKESFFAEHGAGSALVYQTLTHTTGAVELFGKDEFYTARRLGNQSGWLVRASVAGGAGMFVITSDAAGWKSRFLGQVEQLDGPLPDPRIMFMGPQGYRMVVDSATADIFFFPGSPNTDYWILGQSTDGKHVAIAMPDRKADVDKLHDAVFNLKILHLEQGKVLDGIVATMPPMAEKGSIEAFYGTWYKAHCAWTPLLGCK